MDSQEIPGEIQQLMEWFNGTVGRLETAYQELGAQFQKVNRELSETNRRLDALLDSMGPAVLMVDPNLKITVCNQSAERLLQVTASQMVGKKLEDCFPSSTGVGNSLREALEKGLHSVQSERVLHFGDKNIPVTVTGNRVIDSDGMLLGAMETITDLSELKRMQAEMQQDRVLRALGEMAATVAHEIRNPLGGIGGYAGLLARGIPAEDPKRKLVDKIIQGVSSLNKIVSNLLVYTKKTNLQRVKLDLVEWADSILAHAEIEIEKESRPIEVIRDFPSIPLEVDLDPERFQQVALNLLFNAIQAMEGEGKLTLRISSQNGFAHLEIQDTGKGIKEEDLANIFTPFFTTKEQGTGLGLAIVKKIVDLHDGSIEVESFVGKGTCFRIRIPMS